MERDVIKNLVKNRLVCLVRDGFTMVQQQAVKPSDIKGAVVIRIGLIQNGSVKMYV